MERTRRGGEGRGRRGWVVFTIHVPPVQGETEGREQAQVFQVVADGVAFRSPEDSGGQTDA